MAFLQYKNVRVVGVSAAVPEMVINNLTQETNFSGDYTPEDFVKTTGVIERPVTDTLCTSDLCYEAAEKLIAEVSWNKEDIEALVFVSQTPDYVYLCFHSSRCRFPSLFSPLKSFCRRASYSTMAAELLKFKDLVSPAIGIRMQVSSFSTRISSGIPPLSLPNIR